MLTACPSLTPCGLSLGPTHPGWINLPQEPLDLRRLRFSRSLSLLIPTFSLPPRPAHLTVDLQPTTERSPTPCHARRHDRAAASVVRLSPDHCRRRIARPVSCYALLKCWLPISEHPGCLCNSTSFPTKRTLGDLNWRSGLFPSRCVKFIPHALTPVV